MNAYLNSLPLFESLVTFFTLSVLLNILLIGLVIYFGNRANSLQKRIDERAQHAAESGGDGADHGA